MSLFIYFTMSVRATEDGSLGENARTATAVLSQEQLYRIRRAATTLNRNVEGMISDVCKYLQGIADSLTTENGDAAAEQAVTKLEGEAMAAQRAAHAESARTHCGRDTLDINLEVLDKRRAGLQAALERGLEVPVQRALRLLTLAVAAVEEALTVRATQEEWSAERLTQSVEEI